MSLEKQVVVDKIEVTENGHVQVRTATRIVEDGNIISSSYKRHVVAPGQDYSNEDARVQAICAATHTAEVIAAYEAQLEANRLPGSE
jgi:archaellum component FlaF (FlaF/FlaG flagellin family)